MEAGRGAPQLQEHRPQPGLTAPLSQTIATVHVRSTDRAGLLAAIGKRFARLGFEPIEAPALTEPALRRVRLTVQGGWLSFALEELEEHGEAIAWARFFSRELAAPALSAWFWDGEGRLSLALFAGGKKVGAVATPDDLRPASAAAGTVSVSLGGLSQLVGDSENADGLALRIRVDDDDDVAPSDDVIAAFGRAFRIKQLLVDPHGEDEASFLFCFRPRQGSTARQRASAEEQALDESRRAAHEARTYSPGWLVFAAEKPAYPELLATFLTPLLAALAPFLGPEPWQGTRVDEEHRPSQLRWPTSRDGSTAPLAAAVLASIGEGHMVEITRAVVPPVVALWLVPREGSLTFGWSLRALKDEAARRGVFARLDEILTRAVDDARCFGALITAQGSPASLPRQALDAEYLHRTSAGAIRPEHQRTHVRAAGWRVLVPVGASAPAGTPPAPWTATRHVAGTLLRAGPADPFLVTPAQIDALEAYLPHGQIIIPPATSIRCALIHR